MTRVIIVLISLAVLCMLSATGFADIPRAINYQGVLLDSEGQPASGTKSITFSIYDTPTSKAVLWSETIDVEVDANGAFNAILGKVNQTLDAALTGESRYLGITVGADAEISPRTELVSSTYSFRVKTIDGAEAGTVKGGLTLEQSLARAPAKFTLIGSLNDTITMCPATCGSIIRATNENGAEIFDAAVDATDQSMYMTIKGPGGDETTVLSASGTEMSSSSYSKGTSAFQRRISLTGAQGLRVFSDANPDDVLIKMAQTATGAELAVNTPARSFATRKLLSISQDGFSVLNETETDYKFLLDPAGEVTMKSASNEAYHTSTGSDYYSNVAKGMAMQRTVRVGAEGLTVYSESNPTDKLVEIKQTVDGPQILVNNSTASKAIATTVSIDANGIIVYDDGGTTPKTTLTTDGNIISRGQIAVGEGCNWGASKQDHNWAVVLGYNNTASGDTSTITGGYNNTAAGRMSTISGGTSNFITTNGIYSTIGGGAGNYVDSNSATVCGGIGDSAIGYYSTVGGGGFNTASRWAATVAGGNNNRAGGAASTVAGGHFNTIDLYASYSGILGGTRNDVAAGFSSILGGWYHYIDTNAHHAAILSGDSCRILSNGFGSIAAGWHAIAKHQRSFVWSGIHSGTSADSVWTGAHGQIVMAGTGGLYFADGAGGAPTYDGSKLIQTNTGAYLTTGGVWTDSPKMGSIDRSVDGQEILGTLDQLPVNQWSSERNPKVKHIGPTPEEFYTRFGVGDNDGSLASSDMAGIALAAIKELNRKVEEQRILAEKLDRANKELDAKSERIEQLELRLTQLEAAVESVMANQNGDNQGSDKLATTE